MILGIDTGGTFTDFVLLTDSGIRIHKTLSTPDRPETAVLEGIRALGIEEPVCRGAVKIIHGTTIATNAALQRRGVRTLYIGNQGLTDLLDIGRQVRPDLYQLEFEAEAGPVPADLCLGVHARLDANGDELVALDDAELARIRLRVEQRAPKAIAINLLFSFLNDAQERRLEAALEDLAFVSRSSHVLPEYREYERGIATWLNAWLGPLVSSYLGRLDQATGAAPLTVMQSSGSTIAAKVAATRAVNLLLSGPAGGVIAARRLGHDAGHPRLLTFDMGGTSTDVSMIDGEPVQSTDARIGPWPLAIPGLDIHTIGAGGGSIAELDAGGMLQVGPESAGAQPGPACYGLGGIQATVTDANLVLGRLRAHRFLGGRMQLDEEAARSAVGRLAQQAGLGTREMAAGIIDIANQHMATALRFISANRGHDPREFMLCCFGGAGGLHVCDLAESLDCAGIILPARGGVFSALGMPAAAPGRELSLSRCMRLTDFTPNVAARLFGQLTEQGLQELRDEGVLPETVQIRNQLELRYRGQTHALGVDWQNPEQSKRDFESAHQLRYGHQLPGQEVEIATLRVSLKAHAPLQQYPGYRVPTSDTPQPNGTQHPRSDLPEILRDELMPGTKLEGPLLILEETTTSLLKSGWTATVDPFGNLVGQPGLASPRQK